MYKQTVGRRALGLLALAATCLASIHVAAQDKPKVYLLDAAAYKGEVTSIVPEKTNQILDERLRANGALTIADKYNPKAKAKSGNAAIEEAKRQYNSGIGLLVSENYVGAQKAFTKSLELFEANLVDVDTFDILHDAHLRLGLAYVKAGYELDARAVLKIYVSMDPDAKVSTKDYPEALVKIVDKEKRRAKKRGEGILKVGSNPTGSAVTLDGKAMGNTPLIIKPVVPGKHFLVVKGKGNFEFAQKVTVRGKSKVDEVVANLQGGSSAGTTAGPVFLSELDRRIKDGDVDASLNPYLTELCSRSGATHVAFVVLRKSGSGYSARPFLYGAEVDQLVLLEAQPLDEELRTLAVDGYKLSKKYYDAITSWPEDKVVTDNPFASEAMVAVVPTTTNTGAAKPPEGTGSGTAVAVGPGITEPVVIEDDEAWHQKWWVWAGVGALVIGGGAAAGVFLYEGDEDDSDSRGFSASVTW